MAHAPIAEAQTPDDPVSTVDGSRQTSFSIEPPLALTVVADALAHASASIISFSHSAPGHVGGHNSGEIQLADAVARSRADYSEFAPGEPQISGFTLEGVVATAELGPVGSSVVDRQEYDPAITSAEPDVAGSPATAAVEEVDLFAPRSAGRKRATHRKALSGE